MHRKEGVLRQEGEKEGKTSGVKTFSELARPLASAYVCPCGHSERAHPAPSAAINCYFQQTREHARDYRFQQATQTETLTSLLLRCDKKISAVPYFASDVRFLLQGLCGLRTSLRL